MYKPFRIFLLAFLLLSLTSRAQNAPLFEALSSSHTGILFNNKLDENDSLNILNQANIYNGGGVGIGDFNRDGLMDIYLAGNMVSNKLYLNRGSMKFTDNTDAAGVGGNGHWCTGVSVVDINADGWPDIYVSASFRKDPVLRTNLLYINQGINKEGIPSFKESAAAYGLADTGFSTQGYFFDYDRDGDLDLYLVTNQLYDPKTPIRFRPKVTDGSALNTDRLYRNNGNGTFTNVSREAGILIEGWGHAACISDFNMDGWPDVYVANDFVSNDLLYINNRDGTFSNKLGEYFKHTAWNAMGSDVADINNDGLPDLISLEMLPEDNLRKKRMLSGNEYYNYFNDIQFGYEHQYVRNVLQLNSGMTPLGHPVFSDISFMAGMYQTDWSWCPLVADFDNDGLRDLIISNGLPRDVTDLDYISYDNGQGGGAARLSLAMAHTLPVVQIPNYAFKNTNGIQFRNITDAWGLGKASFSNGSAYADLDNDGDLDLVINNINEEAFVYENKLNNQSNHGAGHTLTVKLEGSGQNKNAIGTKLHVYYGSNQLYYEHQPCRGYLSSIDERAHFGLGSTAIIDSIKVEWPDAKVQRLTRVEADKLLTISYTDAANEKGRGAQKPPLFTVANDRYGIHYKPVERDFVDYTIQPTLPHKLSQYGPGIAVGDIDKNGFEDFYLGGTSGNPGLFFMQDAKGFTLDSMRIPRLRNELEEEMGVLLFDVDGDGDLDLYTVTGSYEIPPGNAVAQDRLFINDGSGYFLKAAGALPAEQTNGSCVRAADFDRDGDLDLFVGGRVVSGAYPANPKSFLLKNNGGKFTDVTQQLCPQLQDIGMVTDALWTDFDGDGRVDLVLTGEWMPVTFLKNGGSSFENVTGQTGLAQHLGWWNSLVSGDFDGDGDIDYVAGNLGINSNYQATATEPMTLYAKDLDENGSLDAMLFCFLKGSDGKRQPFPMHTRDDLSSQLVSIRKKFPTYKSYGLATMNDLWSEKDRQNALVRTAHDMQTSFLENKGHGQFAIRPLPLKAQAAPVYGMISEDIDGDGNLDLVLVGNDYGMDPYSGRHDAFNGLCLKGDGRGNFTEIPLQESGFFVRGDAKGLTRVHTAKEEDVWVATQNQDSVVVLAKTAPRPATATWKELKSDDFYADITYADGKKRRIEFYYGSTYLSQSSRKLYVGKKAVKMTITNYKGQKRDLL
ncbi:MAG: VCBS repeat-containing protein [Williamsia sp.]|nr:VCBS repeat-containing protein [Williamsia sp.]